MYHIKEPRENFLTTPAFKTSKWPTHLNNVQLETFHTKLDEELISINRNDKI